MWKLFKDKHIRAGLVDLQQTNNVIVDHYSGGYGSYIILFNQANKHAKNGVKARNNHGNYYSYKAGDFTFQYSLGHEGGSGHNVTTPSGLPYSFVNSGIIESDREKVWKNAHGDSDIHHNAFILIDHRQPFNIAAGNGTFVLKNNYTYGWYSRLAKHNGSSKVDYIGNIFEKAKWRSDINVKKLLKEEFSTNIRTGIKPGPKEGKEIGFLQPSIYIKNNQIWKNGGEIFIPENENQKDQWWMITQYDGYKNGFYSTPNGKRKIEVGKKLPRKYERFIPIKKRKFPVIDTPLNILKKYILKNAGAGVRFDNNGKPYSIDEIDKKYIDYAMNYTDPNKRPGSDPEHDFILPRYPEKKVNLKKFDTDLDGIPNQWETKHGLNPFVPNNNKIRKNRKWIFDKYIVNNYAGYTDLEMYLADKAGDFYMILNKNKL